MVDDGLPDSPLRGDDAVGAAAIADRDALIDLLSVFTHDLNNPLQTVLVLSELALDESMAGTESRARAEQCLAAADRLRSLAQALSALFRGRPLRCEAMWDRFQTLLGRRFERHGIAAELGPCEPREATLPGLCERIVFTVGLGAIAAAAGSGRRHHALALACKAAGGRVALDANLFAIDPADGARVELPFAAPHLDRIAALAQLDPTSRLRLHGAVVWVEIAAGD